MKNLKKVSAVVFSIALILGLTGPSTTFAATTPSLGINSTYGIISSTYTNSANAGTETTINGNVCYTTPPDTAPIAINGTTTSGGCDPATGTAQTAALLDLNNQSCTSLGSNVVLSGTYTPGCYSSTGTMDIVASTTVTLNGAGTYIFRAGGALTTGANSKIVLTNGASASDVFWTPVGGTTLGANSATSATPTFYGNIFRGTAAGLSITLGQFVHLEGRLFAFGSTVTTNANTITVPTTLRVAKTVVNDNAGTAVAGDFNMHVKLGGVEVSGSPAVGLVSPGRAYSLAAGTYVVSEDANVSYTSAFSGDCNSSGSVTLVRGDNKTCTITNNDIAPGLPGTLHIVKTVVNDNGGTKVASDFTIDVAGTNVSSSSFAGSAAGVDVTLDAGTYAVTETSLAGYLQTGSGDCSGTIAAGETKTCTITNNDIAPQLIVNKIVVNDNGSTKVIANFPLFVDGVSVTSGVATTTTIGSHTISETADSGYTGTIGGNCAANGTITLALGDVKTCTITNDDIVPVVPTQAAGGGSSSAPLPPLINVVKVPSPLFLTDSPGGVEYTYTLDNIGRVAVSDITMVGDTCSPIILISGDTDSDNKLDVNETWIYTCSTTLTETHTNIVTAIGWANGISATDIANATVVVGVPVIPPLINVTKVPNPLVLSTGEGMVTYTNKVTNPGIVALSNVRLSDDKCGPVKYISGDTNSDSMLDITETWTYTCSAKLTKTTVNTITASGDANGLTARDFAIATVVVSGVPELPDTIVPKLPDTGISPIYNNATWNIIVPSAILAILTSIYFVRRKQRA